MWFGTLPSTSNHKIQRPGVDLFQLAGTRAEIGDSHLFKDVHHSMAHFLHHAANGAPGFVRAGALLVEPFADATDRRQCALDVANHAGERNFLGRSRQAITAGDASLALDRTGRLQVVEDLFQEPLGNVLLLGDALNPNDRLFIVEFNDKKTK